MPIGGGILPIGYPPGSGGGGGSGSAAQLFTSISTVTAASVAMSPNVLYIANGVVAQTFTLPATMTDGQSFGVMRGPLQNGEIEILPNSGQTILNKTTSNPILMPALDLAGGDGIAGGFIWLSAVTTTQLLVLQNFQTDANQGAVISGSVVHQAEIVAFQEFVADGIFRLCVNTNNPYTASFTTDAEHNVFDCENAITATLISPSTLGQSALHVIRNVNAAGSGLNITVAVPSGSTPSITSIPPGGVVWYMTDSSTATNWYTALTNGFNGSGGTTLAPPQVFTSSGTWTPSTTGSAIFTALVVGGGAGGNAGSSSTGGTGGGGGEVLPGWYLGNVTGNQTLTIAATVAAATDGNPTSIGSLVTAHGGYHNGRGGDLQGLTNNSTQFPGAGTSAGVGGTTSNAGVVGGPGYMRFGTGGSGGGGPTSGVGGNGASSLGLLGGTGAALGGGGGGTNGGTGGNGSAGQGGTGATPGANTGAGGGGGGAGTTGGPGGPGAAGYTIVYQAA